MKDWKILKKELMKNKEVAREYVKLKPRYQIISQMIEARIKRGLTQKELAKKRKQEEKRLRKAEKVDVPPADTPAPPPAEGKPDPQQ